MWSGRGIGRAATAFVPGRCRRENPEKFILDYNHRIVADSDEFYSYTRPTDFRLETREVQVFSTREVPDPKLEAKVKGTFAEFLRFTSPVKTPYPENNLVNARWFPAQGTSRHRSAAALEFRCDLLRRSFAACSTCWASRCCG